MLTLYDTLVYFLLYAFIGWCVEVAYAAVHDGELVNRGFLNGPLCPIYGFGMLLVLQLLTPVSASALALFAGGALLATALELTGGWVLFKVFRARWWDYSDRPFNLGGFICLEFSIYWGLCALMVMRVVHPFFAQLADSMPRTPATVLLGIGYAVLAADLTVTVFTVAGLNQELTRLDEARARLRLVSDRLTTLVGSAAMETDQRVDERRLQLLLAKAEARDAAAEARVQAEEAYARARMAYLDAREEQTEALEQARAQVEEAAARYRMALEEYRAELEQRAAALRLRAVAGPLFGRGRLLRAFPALRRQRLDEDGNDADTEKRSA